MNKSTDSINSRSNISTRQNQMISKAVPKIDSVSYVYDQQKRVPKRSEIIRKKIQTPMVPIMQISQKSSKIENKYTYLPILLKNKLFNNLKSSLFKLKQNKEKSLCKKFLPVCLQNLVIAKNRDAFNLFVLSVVQVLNLDTKTSGQQHIKIYNKQKSSNSKFFSSILTRITRGKYKSAFSSIRNTATKVKHSKDSLQKVFNLFQTKFYTFQGLFFTKFANFVRLKKNRITNSVLILKRIFKNKLSIIFSNLYLNKANTIIPKPRGSVRTAKKSASQAEFLKSKPSIKKQQNEQGLEKLKQRFNTLTDQKEKVKLQNFEMNQLLQEISHLQNQLASQMLKNNQLRNGQTNIVQNRKTIDYGQSLKNIYHDIKKIQKTYIEKKQIVKQYKLDVVSLQERPQTILQQNYNLKAEIDLIESIICPTTNPSIYDNTFNPKRDPIEKQNEQLRLIIEKYVRESYGGILGQVKKVYQQLSQKLETLKT